MDRYLSACDDRHVCLSVATAHLEVVCEIGCEVFLARPLLTYGVCESAA